LICFAFLVVDLVVLDVILSFQDVSGWKLWKMMRDLDQRLKRISYILDVFFANDEEVRMLTGELNLITAGKRLLEKGPSLVVIKKGEHGALLLAKDFVFIVPAYPSENVVDPTGAGDSFGGGFLGHLDKVHSYAEKDIRRAAVYGSVLASFTIERFGIDRLRSLSSEEIESRFTEFQKLVSF